MSDFKSMHVIEALRSGVPSRTVGAYFSEARPAMLNKIRSKLEDVQSSGISSGMIFRGSYGEGKTHMLNTVFSIASEEKMAVSYVSLGKETPLDKLHVLYGSIVANTYLPNKEQPGFRELLEEMTPGSGPAGELLAFTATELETNKIYHVLPHPKCYLLLRYYSCSLSFCLKYRKSASLTNTYVLFLNASSFFPHY